MQWLWLSSEHLLESIALVLVLLWIVNRVCVGGQASDSEREPLLPAPYSVPPRAPGYTQQELEHPSVRGQRAHRHESQPPYTRPHPPEPPPHPQLPESSQPPTQQPRRSKLPRRYRQSQPQLHPPPPEPEPQPQPQPLRSPLLRPQVPPSRLRLHPRNGVDRNQQNQNNPYYIDLRDRARRAGDEMRRCAREIQAAHQAREYLRADLFEQKQAFRREMETLNLEASEWIFKANNIDNGPGVADLHGQFVDEAKIHVDRAITLARERDVTTVRFIVGQGTHSGDGVSKLRPAIEKHLLRKQLVVGLDPTNAGVLVVQL